MLWDVSHEEGRPWPLDAETAELIHGDIKAMKDLLASYPSAE